MRIKQPYIRYGGYGGYGGIAYHHVWNTYIALFIHFITCGVWEAVYILDGLLKILSIFNPILSMQKFNLLLARCYALVYHGRCQSRIPFSLEASPKGYRFAYALVYRFPKQRRFGSPHVLGYAIAHKVIAFAPFIGVEGARFRAKTAHSRSSSRSDFAPIGAVYLLLMK